MSKGIQAAFHATREGVYADPAAGEALKLARFDGVGCANNGASLTIRGDELVVIEKQGVLA